MMSLLSFAVSKSTHHFLTLHAISNFRHIASQRNSITSLKMTPNNVVRIFCYGDSLTHGSSPPSFSSFPYGPHLERELNQSIDDKTEVEVVVRGLPGWTSASMVQHLHDSKWDI
jgi:hypothetical protein